MFHGPAWVVMVGIKVLTLRLLLPAGICRIIHVWSTGKTWSSGMELKDYNGRLEVELPGALDLAATGELRDLLLDALAKDTAADVALKGAGVERIATAAIQV